MLQRLIAAVLGVLGLASIGLGVASATAWRADDVLVATAPTASTSAGTLVVTAPGVLELGGSEVTVSAEAAGGTKVVLAIGKEADVAGWVGTDSHTVIAGLVDRQTLRVEQAETEPAPDPAPEVTETPAEDGAATDPAADPAEDPAAAPPVEAAEAPDPDGSDLWVQQAAGERSAELTWTPQPGRWTLLAAGVGEGAAAPSVVLSWPQTVTTPWLVPGVVVGGILLLIALALGARLWTRARRGEQADWHAVETGAIPIVVRAGLPPAASSGASGSGASTGGASARDASSTGTIPNGSGAVDAGESTSADRSDAESTAADDAPTLILTRRQMREAAAPAPRGSMRRRGPHAAGDTAPSPNRGAPAIPQAIAPATGIPERTAPATSPTVPMPTPGTAGRPVPATRRTTRGSGGPTSSAAPGAASAKSAPPESASAKSASPESVSSQAGPHRSASPAAPSAAAATPAPRTGRKWFARRPTSAPDPAPETAPAGGTAAAPGTAAGTVGAGGTGIARVSGAGAGSSSPMAGPASASGSRPVTGSASAADAPSNDALLSGSDGARTQWTPTRPVAPAAASTPPTGSRADAWRRSWGIPEVDATDQTGQTGSTESTSPASASNPTRDPKGTPDESGRPDSTPRSGKDA
ncbi:hypothetical protein [Pengzhenrongella frigida]|uniref:Uncharacterized protein n=1 Tax=Pengzhenrongella frigida TaxID=1259133 RepID=A0A4Q5MY26_9MICO|nr:hypothetical protein [Cellulomonas sp. HLT2-17]RYV50672.1 hypothetical protein EUA98_12550 [Cellulomonas sp. HLT2-17]